MKYRHNINTEIAYTHIVTRKKQTLIAALGVTIGMSIFIFMNSLMRGFDRSAEESLFKTIPHLRVYQDDEFSDPIVKPKTAYEISLIRNPKISSTGKKILNPKQIIAALKKQKDVIAVSPEVSVNLFYNNGNVQVNGLAAAVDIVAENNMFAIQQKIMVDGEINSLAGNPNGIILGTKLAEKLCVRVGDNISVTSALGVVKTMRVMGLFTTNVSSIDKTKSYMNLASGQQLLKQNQSYITDIKVNVKDHAKAKDYVTHFSQLTGYTVDDWAVANASALAANRVRKIMAMAISSSILLVAGFGIYNILHMTVMQKMNDIAILKAMGFSSGDVIRIFLYQSVIIAIVGILMGLVMATVLIKLLGNAWVGGDIGFFPIRMVPQFYIIGIIFGAVVTILAGYIPSKKASNIDPVSILRK